MFTQLIYMKNEFLNEFFEGRVINFEILKKFIKKKLGEKQSELNLKIQDIEKHLKKNKSSSMFFGGALKVIFSLLISAILGGTLFYPIKWFGFFWGKAGELLNESILMANREVFDEMEVLLYAIGSAGSAVLGVGIMAAAFAVIICGGFIFHDFLGNSWKNIGVLQNKLLSKLSKQPTREHKVTTQMLQQTQTIHENLDKADDCYKYMIQSSLMYKTFTEDEVELLFNLLMEGYDINSLIYLLYHDRLQEFEAMTNYDRKNIIERIDIDNNIERVREYSMHLEQMRQQKFEQTGIYQRKRRANKPYDDMIEQYSAQLESVTNNSLGGKQR